MGDGRIVLLVFFTCMLGRWVPCIKKGTMSISGGEYTQALLLARVGSQIFRLCQYVWKSFLLLYMEHVNLMIMKT
jgi:hypothetical protein